MKRFKITRRYEVEVELVVKADSEEQADEIVRTGFGGIVDWTEKADRAIVDWDCPVHLDDMGTTECEEIPQTMYRMLGTYNVPQDLIDFLTDDADEFIELTGEMTKGAFYTDGCEGYDPADREDIESEYGYNPHGHVHMTSDGKYIVVFTYDSCDVDSFDGNDDDCDEFIDVYRRMD